MNRQMFANVTCKVWSVLSILLVLILIIVIISTTSNGESSEGSQNKNSDGPVKEIAFNLWPDARIPYTIEPYMQNINVSIKNAMKMLEEKTCLKFLERKKSDEKWLNFVRNDEICAYSPLGMRDQNEIQFGLDCSTDGIIQRYIGRAIGLEFEETRPDRDRFISIRPECNVSEISREYNPAALEIIFDYASHMITRPQCLNPSSELGGIKFGSSDDSASGNFSVLDIEKVNAIYNCPGCHSYRFRPINKLAHSISMFNSSQPVHAGHDLDKRLLYICRVYYRGSILIGKLKVTDLQDQCWVAHNGNEYQFSKNFEVLTNPENANLSWILQVGTQIPMNAVPGGRTVDRQTLFIGRCTLDVDERTSTIPSSIYPGKSGMRVPFGHEARFCQDVEILVCNE